MDLAQCTDTKVVLNEVAIQNEKFDLFEFFDDNADLLYGVGACGFITRKQYFFCDAPSYHNLVFENVCSSIFEGTNPNINEYYKVNHYLYENKNYTESNWRVAGANMGAVSIQLISKSYSFVWMPEKINSFQKEKLIEFCSDITEINRKLEEKGHKKINVSFNIIKNGLYPSEASLNMEEFLSKIDEFVDDNCFCYAENLIGSSENIKRI